MPKEKELVVTASLAANSQDRDTAPSELRSLHWMCPPSGSVMSAQPGLPGLATGIASIVSTDDHLFVAGKETVHSIDRMTGATAQLDLGPLADVHELRIGSNRLLVANTASDEAIVSALQAGNVSETRRISLTALVSGSTHSNVGERERFHLNLVAERDGRLFGLVHHTGGRQFLKTVGQRLLKTHGDGGVIDLKSGRARDLGLSAPHNMVVVDSRVLICNSAKHLLCMFDSDWQLVEQVDTQGWGRGLAYDADTRKVYVGISPTRRRYAVGESRGPLGVEVFDWSGGNLVSDSFVPMTNADQINSVHLLAAGSAERLAGGG